MKKWRKCLRFLIGMAVLCVVMLPNAGQAVERCKVQLNPRTGALEVSAMNVIGDPSWGIGPGDTTELFVDEPDCFNPIQGTLRKCHLGDPGTLAEKTLPPSCSLCVGDDAGECCVSYIKSCTPGARNDDSSFPLGDPRVGTGGVNISSSFGQGCTDSPAVASCGSSTGSFLCGLELPELGGNEAIRSSCNEDDFDFRCCRVLGVE